MASAFFNNEEGTNRNVGLRDLLTSFLILWFYLSILIELFETEDDLPTAIMYIVIKENQSHETSNELSNCQHSEMGAGENLASVINERQSTGLLLKT